LPRLEVADFLVERHIVRQDKELLDEPVTRADLCEQLPDEGPDDVENIAIKT
jgi:hypothetical protein